MKIVRDGKEIVLTDQELSNAFWEQELKYDMDYVAYDLPELMGIPEDNEMVVRLKEDEEFCKEVAIQWREYINETITGETEMNCWEDACKYCSG